MRGIIELEMEGETITLPEVLKYIEELAEDETLYFSVEDNE